MHKVLLLYFDYEVCIDKVYEYLHLKQKIVPLAVITFHITMTILPVSATKSKTICNHQQPSVTAWPWAILSLPIYVELGNGIKVDEFSHPSSLLHLLLPFQSGEHHTNTFMRADH